VKFKSLNPVAQRGTKEAQSFTEGMREIIKKPRGWGYILRWSHPKSLSKGEGL